MALTIRIGTGKVEGLDVIRDRLGNSGNIRGSVTPILREASRLGAETARASARKGSTGRLADAIENDAIVFRIRDNVVTARFGVQAVPNPGRGSRLYPLYVHEGTGLFGRLKKLILPRRSLAMVFPGGGKPWPTLFGSTGKVVKLTVRGQKPQPYMQHAYDVAREYVDSHLDDLVNRLVN